jgi:hypothetical protein
MAYGDKETGDRIYLSLAQELIKPEYQIDPSLTGVFAPLLHDVEFAFNCATNPRLYSEENFPERSQWLLLMKDILTKVFKLVFPGEYSFYVFLNYSLC